jgi:hypothetical protein
MKKLKNWLKGFILNLIRDDIERIISDRLAPPSKVEKLEWVSVMALPKAQRVISWRAHPTLKNKLLVVYERPDGKKMQECVPPRPDNDERSMDEYLLSLPHANI